MTFRVRLLAVVLFSLALPFCTYASEGIAADETTGSTTAVAVAPDVSVQTVQCALGGADVLGSVLAASVPIGSACIYRCTSPFDCPDMPDLPPGTCENGCCTYETSCDPCHFANECSGYPLADCWSGCCVYF
jgi:hypothetical protein